MLIELPNLIIVLLNCLFIPTIHLLTAWWTTKLPQRMFHKEINHTQNLAQYDWIYEKIFFVRLWKDCLPDGGPWIKGFSKAKLTSTTSSYFTKFITETRRGEFSHYLQALLLCSCLTWTPCPLCIIIIFYALLSNLPCILNLRYTRNRLMKILQQRVKYETIFNNRSTL